MKEQARNDGSVYLFQIDSLSKKRQSISAITIAGSVLNIPAKVLILIPAKSNTHGRTHATVSHGDR